MILVLLCRLERTPTFLVPIINPPFADNSRHLPTAKNIQGDRGIFNRLLMGVFWVLYIPTEVNSELESSKIGGQVDLFIRKAEFFPDLFPVPLDSLIRNIQKLANILVR